MIEDRPAVTILRPTRGWRRLRLREAFAYRDLAVALGVRDVKLRYRQTALGVLWVVAQPLLAAGVLSFVFGKIARLPSEGIPYFLFAYVGFLGWNLFSGVLQKVVPSLINNTQLISKVYFPRLLVPVATTFSVVIDFCVAAALGVVLMVRYGVAPTVQTLAAPAFLVLLLLMAFGLGLVGAGAAVSYRDVNFIVPVVLQFVLYASPVAYSVKAVPSAYRAVYQVNPVAPLLEGLRWSLLGTSAPQGSAVAYSAGVTAVLVVAGLLLFARMERSFADVI